MTELRFEWDSRKAGVNLRKHGVSFSEAETVFADQRGLIMDDPDHSAEEDRFVLLGLSQHLRLLVVVHCYRASETRIRIISARRATRAEEVPYNERWRR